jgi:CHAT domain-containing protein
LLASEVRANPLELCQPGHINAESQVPAAESLLAATQRAEDILRIGLRDLTAGDQALVELDVVDGTAPAPDYSALAAYCSAAGEAMRLAREGSAERSRSYLLAALAFSEQDSSPTLQTEIAFRLALVSATLPMRPNARSARLARSTTALPFEPAVVDDGSLGLSTQQNACFDLLRTDLNEQSNWAVATHSLQCSLDTAPALEDPSPIARALLQLARINMAEAEDRPADRQELLAMAVEAAIEGMPEAARIADPELGFELLFRLTEAALDAGAGQSPQMLAALATMRAVAGDDAGKRAKSLALDGRALLASGDNAAAAELIRQAIYFESQADQPLRMADWYLLLGEAEPQDRPQHVMQAYNWLETVRPLLPRYDVLTQESNFQLRMQPVFTAAVDVQFSRASHDAGDASLLLAQQIVESFRQAEIQSAFGADCVPPREPVDLADLREGEILLYPILLEDRVEVLYAAKRDGEPMQYRRFTARDGANRARIEQLVSDATYSLGYGFDDSWQQPMAELYQLLIEPIEPLLGDDASLIVIPDGVLRRLPFAALRDEDGELLIQKTSISVSPSLAYTQPGNSERERPSVVAASLSRAVELARGSFSALAGTREEAEMAVGLGTVGQHHGLHLDNFRANDLRNALRQSPVDILHLATHASFNGRSDRAFIVADGEAILLSELRQLLGSNYARGELISLIILSACETALGDDQASMGLAGSAVQAGAESAVASLWQVDDAGTLELMRNFYSFYTQGQGKAEAMRNAQLALIDSDGPLSDPGIWAAFTLLGAWR